MRLSKLWQMILVFACFNFAHAQLNIVVEDLGLERYQSVFISDLDFLQVGTSEQLFRMSITNTSGQQLTNTYLRIDFAVDGELLAFSETDFFTVPAGAMGTLDNVALSNGTFAFDPTNSNTIVRISDSGINEAAEDLRSNILSSGQLPVGEYQLTINAYQSQNRIKNPAQDDLQGGTSRSFSISNPTLINLVSPGANVNSGIDYEVYTTQPVFNWNGNSGEYQLVVFKKRNEFGSIEDILNTVPVYASGRLNSLSLQYPDGTGPSGAPAVPLEYGDSYVWLVKSFIQTSSGENEVISEIWSFTVVDPAAGGFSENSMAKQELEQLLRQLLGNRAEEIIRQLDNYDLKTIRFNGSAVSPQELYQILERYRDQNVEIKDLNIISSN